MSKIRGRDTKPELVLKAALRRAGLWWYRLHRTDLPGWPDIVFVKERVAVFMDGCFWHGCPRHYRAPASNKRYWLPKIRGNKARDKRNTAALRRAGWSVVRVWEHDVNERPDWCVAKVARAVGKAERRAG